jgi:rRNA-processing protein FCF1
MIATHLGRVVVSPPIIDEVDGFAMDDCANLGLDIFNPTLDEYMEAAGHKVAGLSAEDYLCLILSKRLQAICLTNDKALHKACRGQNVSCMCGLRPMLALADTGVLPPKEALEIARAIYSNNMYITDTVIEQFEEELARIAGGKVTGGKTKSRKRTWEGMPKKA